MPPPSAIDQAIAVRVVIAEDHTLVREGTREILEQQPDLRVVGEAADGPAAVELVSRLRPDVVLLDLRLPELNGIEVTERLSATVPEAKVVILSAYDDEDYVIAALQAGAAGYLLKTVPGQELVQAVRAVHAGETVLQEGLSRKLAQYWRQASGTRGGQWLSRRELEVLRLLAAGCTNKEIAARLAISLRTVEGHLGNIFSKLGVGSRTEAALYAVTHLLVPLQDPIAGRLGRGMAGRPSGMDR